MTSATRFSFAIATSTLTATLFASASWAQAVDVEFPEGEIPLEIVVDREAAVEFILENQAGAATLKAKRRLGREHPIETVGESLRGMMSWISESKIVDKKVN